MSFETARKSFEIHVNALLLPIVANHHAQRVTGLLPFVGEWTRAVRAVATGVALSANNGAAVTRLKNKVNAICFIIVLLGGHCGNLIQNLQSTFCAR